MRKGSDAIAFGWMLPLAAVTLAGCGGGGTAAPPTGAITAVVVSGDQQVGPAATALPLPIVVGVAQGGSALGGQTVNWTVTNASNVAPGSSITASNGNASTSATLQGTAGVVTISAAVTGVATPVVFRAYAVPAGAAVVELRNNVYVPATLTVAAGSTVAFVWKDGANNHNVVPDATIPATSGPLNNGPRVYTVTLAAAGTYRFFCQAHGGSGGAGMSGTITVN